MSFKLVKHSKCTLLCKVLSRTFPRSIHSSEVTAPSDVRTYVDKHPSDFTTKLGRRARKVLVKVNQKHIEAVTAVLEKYNIDTSHLDKKSSLFHDTPWGVEKKIMLLEELGASNITTEFISLFHVSLQLPVKIFKAHISVGCNETLAEKLSPHVDNYTFDPQEVGLNEDQPTKVYLHRCLIHYTKYKLELNQTQANKLKARNNHIFLIQSFRLLTKVLHFLQDDIKLSKNKIINHYLTLFSLHPEQFENSFKLVADIGKERALLIAKRYPPMFEHNLEDLKIIVSFLKKHLPYSEKIAASPFAKILQITSDELKRRFEFFTKNRYTQDLVKHPRFLSLIALYHIVLPRLRYLEEHDLQYATIHSLTNGKANYCENLATLKGLRKHDIQSFFHVNFGDDAEKVLLKFKKHAYYRFVPLLSMRKSLEYLRGIFPEDVIRDNSYAILYNQVDLQAVYELVTKDPENCKLAPNQLLTMCLYKMEVNNHFTGDPVLAPGKYAELLKENVDLGEQMSDTIES